MIAPTPIARQLRGVVAIGGSAGGVEAVSALVAGLPVDPPYAVLIALHLPTAARSMLAHVVNRAGPLPAAAARSGEHIEPGRIYVAVPDRHLLVDGQRLLLSADPPEHGHRPGLNPLFRSVAVAFGPNAVGVLLSGVLDDGVPGLGAIRSRGGRTIAQSPDDALFADLPRAAIDAGVVDLEASAADIGALLTEFAAGAGLGGL
jgi:two-component system, chemotaxis family, protein-glutamate methylesterase/glutaminase